MTYQSLAIEWEHLLGSREKRKPRISKIEQEKRDQVAHFLMDGKNKKGTPPEKDNDDLRQEIL